MVSELSLLLQLLPFSETGPEGEGEGELSSRLLCPVPAPHQELSLVMRFSHLLYCSSCREGLAAETQGEG